MNIENPIELINIVPFNPLISKCQIKVCWVGYQPNRNRSVITKEVATEMANSLPGSPIVGYYNEETKDFEEHNKVIEVYNGKVRLTPTTKPYGFVDLNARVWFQWFVDADGISREYLVTEGWLWTGQFPECERVIEQGNNHSMELSDNPKYLEAYWTKDENGNKEFFIINEAIISKLCILGEEYEPCFEGSSITAPKIEFSFNEEFKNELFSMIKEIKNILNEGGAKMLDNENNPVVDEEEGVQTEEPAAEPEVTEPATEEPATEGNEPENEGEGTEGEGEDAGEGEGTSEYNLDEISEYVELKDQFDELTAKFNKLSSDYEALKTENEGLVAFKADADRKAKKEMIDSFYMLTDEDKKDVVDNINNYSLSDIEAKLSILCVRNRVSFDSEENNNEPVNYNLNSGSSNGEDVPEWIKAIQTHVAEN